MSKVFDQEGEEIEIPPLKKVEKALSAPDFFILTSPEMDALERAAADGRQGRHYANLEQETARVHQIQGASHYVRLDLTHEEKLAGLKHDSLETLSGAQDADATLAFLYISRLLAPPSPLPANLFSGGWVDFDDVIAKIGWAPESTAERRAMHARLMKFILFGERAQVIGSRRGIYTDKHTGTEIRTTIRSPIWRIAKIEEPEQGSLYPELEVPVRVQLVVMEEWSQLLTQPQTAQYLPMGELLGSIPGNKPSGAWARVIGLALASFWRRLPRETIDGSVKPTRRELLERYPPKTGSVLDVLSGDNPQYAIKYWCVALQLLVGCGFLDNQGDAIIDAKTMRANLPRKGWTLQWLDSPVDLRPGPVMQDAMKNRVAAKPIAAPRKRGRPRKNPA